MPIKTLIVLVLGFLFLYGLFTVGAPFLLAIVFALFLETPIRFVMRMMRVNRAVASSVVCTAFMLALFGLLYWIGVRVAAQLVEYSRMAPHYFENAASYFQQFVDRWTAYFNAVSPEWGARIEAGVAEALRTLTQSLHSLLGNVSRYSLGLAVAIPDMFFFLLVFVMSLYLFCSGFPAIRDAFLSYFDEQSRPKVERVLADLRQSVFGFLRAQVLLSAFTYVSTLTGLLILKVDYALAIALLVTIVDILPVLGTGSVLVPWAVYSFVKGDLVLAIGLVVLFVFIVVVRRILEPKVLGDSIGLSALATLASLYIGYKLFGAIGLFFGPTAVLVFQAMRKVGLLQFKIRL
ncbi:MAG: sporulation integral membrane protein YtvI [Candidatus Reconcilbacillus cellulovorans]|uniref:Sporulation integral membrane protein YtvI n=1 Tax=Candidatus Reconcilbacillus cellulovorans TaxID=1906605 RepID=A0A2A6DXR7_9BACL|nr:MAG: sporulation integral membrane protein YtvI [Candidatus Reconcilbacillus cellulovorans]